jgi:hypothetical protein
MPTIQRPLYEGFATRHLATKGMGGMAEVADEVLGVIQLDRIAAAENWWTQRIQGFARFWSSSPNAGEYAWWGLHNPEGSGVIISVISIHEEEQSANHVRAFQINRADVFAAPYNFTAVTPTGVSTDTRANGVRSLGIPWYRSDLAATFGDPMYQFAAANDPVSCAALLPLVIAPGSSYAFRSQAVNVANSPSMCWAEIPAYSAEL